MVQSLHVACRGHCTQPAVSSCLNISRADPKQSYQAHVHIDVWNQTNVVRTKFPPGLNSGYIRTTTRVSVILFHSYTVGGSRAYASSPLTTKRSLVAMKLSCHLSRNKSCHVNIFLIMGLKSELLISIVMSHLLWSLWSAGGEEEWMGERNKWEKARESDREV